MDPHPVEIPWLLFLGLMVCTLAPLHRQRRSCFWSLPDFRVPAALGRPGLRGMGRRSGHDLHTLLSAGAADRGWLPVPRLRQIIQAGRRSHGEFMSIGDHVRSLNCRWRGGDQPRLFQLRQRGVRDVLRISWRPARGGAPLDASSGKHPACDIKSGNDAACKARAQFIRIGTTAMIPGVRIAHDPFRGC